MLFIFDGKVPRDSVEEVGVAQDHKVKIYIAKCGGSFNQPAAYLANELSALDPRFEVVTKHDETHIVVIVAMTRADIDTKVELGNIETNTEPPIVTFLKDTDAVTFKELEKGRFRDHRDIVKRLGSLHSNLAQQVAV